MNSHIIKTHIPQCDETLIQRITRFLDAAGIELKTLPAPQQKDAIAIAQSALTC